ncbi:hypothetical protein C0V76_03715 [Uliginosibacterium sp. TH139]|nr:hypothetical protein C0V76_03715 [Uliginosibacterium sp. TH139]
MAPGGLCCTNRLPDSVQPIDLQDEQAAEADVRRAFFDARIQRGELSEDALNHLAQGFGRQGAILIGGEHRARPIVGGAAGLHGNPSTGGQGLEQGEQLDAIEDCYLAAMVMCIAYTHGKHLLCQINRDRRSIHMDFPFRHSD